MSETQGTVSMMQLLDSTAGHLCPDCGCLMTEVERLRENGFTFVWFECRQPYCNGQWLEKIAG